jgi:hypothetical protein
VSWLSSIGRRYQASEDPLRTLRRIELVALLLGVLLCLQLAYGGFQLAVMSAPEPVQPAADSLQVPAVFGPVVVAASERNAIIARPVFWSGRQPVSAVRTRTRGPGKPGELKGIKLVGVFGSGEHAGIIALVKDKKRRILVGESLEGWTLKSVDSGEIRLTNGKRKERLTLQRREISKAAPAKKASAARARGPVRQYKPPMGAETEAKPRPEATGGKAAESSPSSMAGRTLGLGPKRLELKAKKTDQ